MQTGALTGYLDVAQVVLYVFWIFFAGLIFYLRREDKREGYPLESDRTDRSGGRVSVVGFPSPPSPKTFLLPHGGTQTAPRDEKPQRPVKAEPDVPWPGSPLRPTGNPLKDGVGPAAWAERHDIPDPTWEGDPKIVPMRVATDFWVAEQDPDPRGMPVVALDGEVAGTVKDIWVDRSEFRVLFLEMELAGSKPEAEPEPEEAEGEVAEGEEAKPKRRRTRSTKADTILLPINFARVNPYLGQVKVVSLMASQFADVPRLRKPDQVTLLEEDKITAYFGGGHLYAHPSRQEPLL